MVPVGITETSQTTPVGAEVAAPLKNRKGSRIPKPLCLWAKRGTFPPAQALKGRTEAKKQPAYSH